MTTPSQSSHALAEMLGLRLSAWLPSACYPLLLTASFFGGPLICMYASSRRLQLLRQKGDAAREGACSSLPTVRLGAGTTAAAVASSSTVAKGKASAPTSLRALWAHFANWLRRFLDGAIASWHVMRGRGVVVSVSETVRAGFHDRHLITWRNFVVAPLSEEFVFRACMAPLLLLQVSAWTGTAFF